MVGDRVSSDIIGAHNAGIKSVLVKQGEYSPYHLHNKIKPDYIIEKVSELPSIIFN